jgi:hypothetical protein
LIAVFDPLAVLMLIAASLTQLKQREWKASAESSTVITPEPEKSVEEVKTDDNKNETNADTPELPVVTDTTEQPEARITDEVTTGPSVDATAEVAAVGEAVKPPKKQRKRKTPAEVTEVTEVAPEPTVESKPQDKSFSEDDYFNPSAADTIDKMIETGDQDSLESAYKKIVKELAKKNRSKSTHWGPLKTK